MTQHSIARVYGIMQELQQMREKTCKLSAKNSELAKALTTTKQELTKAREAQSAVFTNKVLEWMEARHRPVEVQHQAIQCSFEEYDRIHLHTYASKMNAQLERDPPLPPCHSSGQMQNLCVRSSSAVKSMMLQTEDGKNVAGSETKDNGKQLRRTLSSSPGDLMQTNTQAGVVKRLRQRDASVSYVEPKLNTKLRRGDYYGLGKRTNQTKHTRRIAKRRVVSGLRRTNAGFGQQFSPFRSRTTGRSVQRISYAEPKLNTKLRQGDKFTFTT
ncbi:unnamed protein product [Peronospora belbahrii]|uniref:Shugoshin C-terminal domain-containing protein n=1 Tax=Peronospora belbahrii TaxID=622444 RepID=A0AAU9LDY5_9STRA|nr:unnamed protein product [Peronospora belbahrii]CAH0517316.1 unnamed protein product [Peronospora belbahrii]